MKNRVQALLLGTAFSLAICGNSPAMSELVSMTMEPLWPATPQPGNVVRYKLTVERAGQGLLVVELSSAGLPAGASATFSPGMLRFTGRQPTLQTAIMTITCTNLTATESYPFSVTGRARRESITITNTFAPPMPLAVSRPVLILDPLPDGSSQLRGQGLSGQTYQIETTTDLANPAWTSLGTSTADANGRFTVLLAGTMTDPMRFYRAVGSPTVLVSQP